MAEVGVPESQDAALSIGWSGARIRGEESNERTVHPSLIHNILVKQSLRLITLDYVLRKGTQSNWSGKQARICVLCDAFCPTHSAATSQRRAPAPRQRCIFPQNKQPQRQQAAGVRAYSKQAGTDGGGRSGKGGSSFCPPPALPACVSLLVGVPPKTLSPPPTRPLPLSLSKTRLGDVVLWEIRGTPSSRPHHHSP